MFCFVKQLSTFWFHFFRCWTPPLFLSRSSIIKKLLPRWFFFLRTMKQNRGREEKKERMCNLFIIIPAFNHRRKKYNHNKLICVRWCSDGDFLFPPPSTLSPTFSSISNRSVIVVFSRKRKAKKEEIYIWHQTPPPPSTSLFVLII